MGVRQRRKRKRKKEKEKKEKEKKKKRKRKGKGKRRKIPLCIFEEATNMNLPDAEKSIDVISPVIGTCTDCTISPKEKLSKDTT